MLDVAGFRAARRVELTKLGESAVALPQVGGHARDDEGDKAGAHDEPHPHAENVHLEAAIMMHAAVCQRPVEEEERRVAGDGDPGHGPGVGAWQDGGGDHQRQQVKPDQRVTGATGEIEQAGQSGNVQQHLYEDLGVADNAPGAAAHQGEHVQHRQQCQGGEQCAQRECQLEDTDRNADGQAGTEYGDIAQQKKQPQDAAGCFIRGIRGNRLHGAIMQWGRPCGNRSQCRIGGAATMCRIPITAGRDYAECH